MSAKWLMAKIFFSLTLVFFTLSAKAGSPVWTLTPLTATTISVPSSGTATVQYQVTNQSSKTHTLSMQSIHSITQTTTGLGVCGNPFTLRGKASCTLSLQINGSQLTQPILDGPIICEQGSPLQCYRPAAGNTLHVTQAAPITNATITVANSPLTLTTNGSAGVLTITNTSLLVTAKNITSNLAGTALDGNVTQTGNTCASVPPLGSCTLTYTPGGTVVSQTNFTIKGSNTNTVTAAIQINASAALSSINPPSGSASGGTGVTLTGSALTGATSVTFGGVAATGVNVVNSTTVTAVTPAHATGSVDVTITTPSGSATLTNGYTYLTTAIGQSAYGGTIACLNGGLNNLIAATTDNSTATAWGTFGLTTGATSTTDGATNTTAIINTPGQTPVNAAAVCANYETDSQGNTPCQAGNTCYNDWFLPAGQNLTASGQLNCLNTNQTSIGGFAAAFYWSSTENNGNVAWLQDFDSGSEIIDTKNNAWHVRCVRSFTP
jgi:hypothetical protein